MAGLFEPLMLLDDFNRVGLGIEVDVSLLSERVTCVLNRIIEWRGKPGKIRCDNGSAARSKLNRETRETLIN